MPRSIRNLPRTNLGSGAGPLGPGSDPNAHDGT
jgi:hypothetical protein